MGAIQYPWLRFFWVPLISFTFCSLSWGISLTDSFARQFLQEFIGKVPYDILFSTVYAVFCSEVSLRLFVKLQRWFPLETRLKTLMVLHVFISTFVWVEMFTLSQALLYGFDTPLKMLIFKQNILLALMIALSMNVVHISMILFQRWKTVHSEAELLRRVHLETQNSVLKQQIDPHFLFNSLNTLTALIEDEPKDAVRFVQHLSNVYRYVLQSRPYTTVPLREELSFVRAYLHLHELRFGENFHVECLIPDSVLGFAVPPLVVQLCVENAVKHNIISRQKPLQISMSIVGKHLRVGNTFQPKPLPQPSTNLGLENIRQQYSLLTQESVKIEQKSGFFMVDLPLLASPEGSLHSPYAHNLSPPP